LKLQSSLSRVKWLSMEPQTEALEGGRRHDESAVRMAKAGLILAGLGALIVILDPFGIGIVGLIFGAIGAVLAYPYGSGGRWYYFVAGGAVLAIIARLVAGPHQTTGGWLAVIASLAILVGATLAFPGDDEE
jgi:hypothetical protein